MWKPVATIFCAHESLES